MKRHIINKKASLGKWKDAMLREMLEFEGIVDNCIRRYVDINIVRKIRKFYVYNKRIKGNSRGNDDREGTR